MLTVTREILHQKTLEDVFEAVRKARRGNSLNFEVADSKGGICDIECTPKSVDTLFTEDLYFAHTNYFLSKRLGIQKDIIRNSGVGFGRDSVFRCERMYKFVDEKRTRRLERYNELLQRSRKLSRFNLQTREP